MAGYKYRYYMVWICRISDDYTIVANVWRGTPFFGVSILAKLQTIPKDYYEAAEIDGAGLWQKFRHITLPEVKM